MAADLPVPLASGGTDPELQMGLDLEAHQRRKRLAQIFKIAIVWAALVGLMIAVLMQLRFDRLTSPSTITLSCKAR
jgi:hypothetical protein